MKAYEVQNTSGIDALALVERPEPKPGFGQVTIEPISNPAALAFSAPTRNCSTISEISSFSKARGVSIATFPAGVCSSPTAAIAPSL